MTVVGEWLVKCVPAQFAARLMPGLAALAFIAVPFHRAALADGPNITGEITIIENRPPDDIFGYSGLFLTLRADVTHDGGPGAFIGPPANAEATSNNEDFPFPQPIPLPDLTWGSTGNFFITLLPITAADFPLVEGRFTYTVTDNAGLSDSRVSHPLNRTEVIPLPINLAVDNLSTSPRFSFTDPDPNPNPAGLDRFYAALIVDANLQGVAHLSSVNPSTPAVQIPNGLLCPCLTYHFRAESIDYDVADGDTENLATAFLTFNATAVPHNGDMSKDCQTNGRDIQPFVDALLSASTDLVDRCLADFSDNNIVDMADVPGFVNKLLES